MRNIGNRLCAICSVIATLAFLIGCNEIATEQTPVAAKSAVAASEPNSTDVAVGTPTPADDAGIGPAEKVDSVAIDQATAAPSEYKPPFPDRVDLFVAPKRQRGAASIQGEGQGAVELLGFIRLDRPKVVLSVNGQIVPIDEGETQYGIEVISIQPPMVVLQRGRQRWQASLEN